jgi:membrane protein YdbS with pleckstrin-like domain
MRRRRDPHLQRFLLEGERVVVDVRQHWGVIALPIVYTLAGLFATMWVDARIRVEGGGFARALWLLWFVLLGWLGFQIAQWRHDRFIATDKRLLLNYGLFTQKVAMMPLIKVTDMSYQRSVPGRIFGYGRFVLESAGQDQALRQVDWVPHPDATYRILCTEIFGVPSRERVTDPDRDDGYLDDGTGGSPAGPQAAVVSPLSGAETRSGGSGMRSGGSAVDERWSYSRAIPLHQYGDSAPMPSGEVIYSSDAERRRRRMADTGPIPQTPPQTPPPPPAPAPGTDD